ncbi:HutD family protein [Paenibacillus sp. GCM10027628]|uniref:HutD/Ves family protein n=1 Tax=Paenibacillus sp. GCM10027628 TaxID=3273413 RepID=UPI00362F5448
MSISIKVIKKDEQVTTAWSGGTTTQLAIYPEDADYSKRDFMWRISSAQIHDEQSLFTCLPDYWRQLMVIRGDVILEFEGSHRVALKPFEQASFSGGWVTRSIGKITDFNLMTAAGCRGELEALSIEKGTSHEVACGGDAGGALQGTEAFYCTEGRVMLSVNGDEPLSLEECDLILINWRNSDQHVKIKIHNSQGETTAHLIRASMMTG